ncbi:hypothetical protein LOK49_LG03G02915 [Camellia lanceoleosa]|uniref:Uncharacterized protein n=1 Tax=Camellia lanceoleosa TaxID=1840588 RepID=A0ACC0IE83_9ERIC|nr:hypothetical protein LOK49_LG03G02915 [Camellia lanceoleosa]
MNDSGNIGQSSNPNPSKGNTTDGLSESNNQSLDLQRIAYRLQRLRDPESIGIVPKSPIKSHLNPRWAIEMEKEDLSFRNIPDRLEVARIRADEKKRDALSLLSDPIINPDDQDPNRNLRKWVRDPDKATAKKESFRSWQNDAATTGSGLRGNRFFLLWRHPPHPDVVCADSAAGDGDWDWEVTAQVQGFQEHVHFRHN